MINKGTYYSITLQSYYKNLYKELLELGEPTEALSQAVRFMIKLSKTENLYKEALLGLDAYSSLLRNFHPTSITTFLCILSEYPLNVLENNKNLIQPIDNEFIEDFKRLIDLKELCTTSILENEAKVGQVRSIFCDHENIASVGLVKFAQLTNNVSKLTAEAKSSLCYLANQFYIPTAHKLGLVELKTKFEDCCMEIEHPQEYIRILKGMVHQLEPMKRVFMKQFCKGLNKKLRTLKAPIKFTYRLKGALSIWNKLQSQNLIQEELHDYIGVRVIIKATKENEIELCSKAYEIVKACYQVDHSKTRHWLLEPKESGYQALHVTIIDQPKTMIEIQIKSKSMHEAAERGPAAHWLYKKDIEEKESRLQKLIVEDLRKILRDDLKDD